MRQFQLTTPYGDSYYIHDGGEIERGDGRNLPLSGKWIFRGVMHAEGRGFGFGLPSGVTLADLADGKQPTLNKSGRPRFTVADIDNGTFRVWGNTRYHGIASVRRVRA